MKPGENTDLCLAADHSDSSGGMSCSEHGIGQ